MINNSQGLSWELTERKESIREAHSVQAVTGKNDFIPNCCHFSSSSAAFPSSTFPPCHRYTFYFTSGCRCDGKESAAAEFCSAPNNGLIYLTSPPPRLSPAKNNQHFSFHGSLALRLWDHCFISSFSQMLFFLLVGELIPSALHHHRLW